MPLGIDASFNAGGDDFKGGIEESFDPPLKEEHKCPICLLGLREPVQTRQCGHRFCRDCIVRSLRSEDCGKRCPIDNGDLIESQLFPDISVETQIGELTVWCRNHKETEGCIWKGILNEIEKHMTECQFIKCVNNCGSVLLKKDCREHALHACSKQYCRVCKEGIARSEFESHAKECERREKYAIVNELNAIAHYFERAKSIALRLERQVDSRLALADPQNHGIIGQQDNVFTNGTFIWKIDNYIDHQNQAMGHAVNAIHSPPFYTGVHGYKMCLRMNFNDSCSHISLFVHMMKGDWDDVLEWPFTGHITLSILDQSNNVEIRQPISETFEARPSLSAFQKPTIPRNHTGYGYVEFCNRDQLVQGQFIKNNSLLVRIQVFH